MDGMTVCGRRSNCLSNQAILGSRRGADDKSGHHNRSIRFTKNEWDAVVEAAEKAGITPGSFVRRSAARVAADDLYLYDGGLTPELAELIEKTFRRVHLLAYLKEE